MFRLAALAAVAAGATGYVGLANAEKRPLFPAGAPYSDRAGFYRQLSKVQDGMPVNRVERLLGKPDDIRRPVDDLGAVVADEIWCYGTDGHMGFPTLGQVCVVKGKVYWTTQSDTTFEQRVDERTLRAIMLKLDGSLEPIGSSELWLIQTANLLIDLGKDKALFVFDEFERVQASFSERFNEDLKRLIFEIPAKPGYPTFPQVSMQVRELKPKFRKESRFPMVIRDDIPFTLTLGNYWSMGMRTDPYGQGTDYRKFPLRTKRLRPPDDPFQTYANFIASDEWPFPDKMKEDKRFPKPYKQSEGEALAHVLSLVSEIYQPVDFRSTWGINGLDYEKYHRDYAQLGGRWDEALQRYVRKDGITLPARFEPRSVFWFVPKFNNSVVEVSLRRHGESETVNACFSNQHKTSSCLPESLRFIDAKTGAVLVWEGVTSRGSEVPHGYGASADGEKKYLAGPRITQMSGGLSFCTEIALPVGAEVRVELKTRERTVRGPTLKP